VDNDAMQFEIRPATTSDITAIRNLCEPLVEKRVLLGKELVELYESVQEFLVCYQGEKLIGCGALHVMWEDLAEVRTLVVDDEFRKTGIGHKLLNGLVERAEALGVKRIFCLTFEVEFFGKHNFEVITDTPIEPEVYAEMVRSHDEGVAEFLDLARVKQNTLGNTRMLRVL
jgi:amino-acid N-acetyltransferase